MKITRNNLREMYFKKKMTMEEIGAVYRISHSAVAKQMDACGMKRRNRSDAAYVLYNKKECFGVTPNKNRLLARLGPILYWCEGTSTDKGGRTGKTLAFTNTNVDMLKIWIKYLLLICNLKKEKIRIRVYLHKNQNADILKKYWSKMLQIPLGNFENASFTEKNSTRPGYKGTVKIKVHNIKLCDIIKKTIERTVGDILLTAR